MKIRPVFRRPSRRTRHGVGFAPGLLAVLFLGSFLALPARAALLPVTTDILNEQRDKWSLGGISSYVYEGSALCFCIPDFVRPHRVTVINGAVTELFFADTLLPDNDPVSLQFYLPVEGFLDLLQDRIDDNWMTVEAMFDPALGYPLSFFTDFSDQIADDEYWFTIESLVEVPLSGTALLLLLSLAVVARFRLRAP
ncbi:MAG: DUF6174 domain-containing protein [Halioglobus sp.]|nr:DUF6174 domain-containing protein [Halioglobus sp.]